MTACGSAPKLKEAYFANYWHMNGASS